MNEHHRLVRNSESKYLSKFSGFSLDFIIICCVIAFFSELVFDVDLTLTYETACFALVSIPLLRNLIRAIVHLKAGLYFNVFLLACPIFIIFLLVLLI